MWSYMNLDDFNKKPLVYFTDGGPELYVGWTTDREW
jgi:hypothetical protein